MPELNELVQAAFATRESAESELLETQRGEYFIVRTDRITPARTPALTEVEAKVTDAWQAEERRKLADAKVKEALDKANAGTAGPTATSTAGKVMIDAPISMGTPPTTADPAAKAPMMVTGTVVAGTSIARKFWRNSMITINTKIPASMSVRA